MFDVIDEEYKLGGAPFNVAAHMAKLGNDCYILSAVGKDDLGDQIIREAKDLDVHTNLIYKNEEKPTGTVQVEFQNGEPDYEIVRDVAWDYLAADFDAIIKKKWSVVAFGSLAQRSAHNQVFYRNLFDGLRADWVYFDCNLRQEFYSKLILEDSLHFANIAKFNEQEISVVSKLLYETVLFPEKFAEQLNKDYSIDLVVYTWGKEGSKAWYKDEYHSVPSIKVNTQDTVGAGDAFSAGFLHSWIHGTEVKESLRNGNRLGGYVASRSGAIPPYDDEVKDFFGL